MNLDLTRLALAATVYLLAVVLAWPAGHPMAAVVLLSVYAGLLTAAAVSRR